MSMRPTLPDYLETWNSEHPTKGPGCSCAPVTKATAKTDMDRFRLAMRKHDPKAQGLPWTCQSYCHPCDAPVPARFELHDDAVVLVRDCPTHGRTVEQHQDTIFTKQTSDRAGSAEMTFGGARVQPILRGLPRTVETLCPECAAVILGRYYEHEGVVWIEKTCPDHGYVRDIINSDVNCYLRSTQWSWSEGFGQSNPRVKGTVRCPSDCGLCAAHQSTSVLSQIDLTTRCNLRCPICFANAGSNGRVMQPTYEQTVELLQQLRDMRPIPATAVQFTGGEPTMHPRFHDVVAKANEMGFSHVQIATNGITHANEEFMARSAEVGLHTLYLQFDGVGEKWYRTTRGEPVWEKKLACIENCRKYGMKVCLVPTIIKGINDSQVREILWFAIRNADVISGISYQPVCFTGRINHAERLQRRYTLGDLGHDIADALPDCDAINDFFPLSLIQPISKMLSCVDGKPKIETNCHTDCTYGTYLLISPDGKPYPYPKVFDIGQLFFDMDKLTRKIIAAGRAGKMNFWDKLRVYWIFRKNFSKRNAPPGLTVGNFINTLVGCVDKSTGRGQNVTTWRTVMVAGMHFQDRYNFDVERIKRCVILYSTPEGIYPFCTYNSGPTYRDYIEAAHSTANDQWLAENPDQPVKPSSHPRALMPWKGRLGEPVDEPMFTPELERRIERELARYDNPDWAGDLAGGNGDGNGDRKL